MIYASNLTHDLSIHYSLMKAYFDLLVDAVALLGADKSVAREEMRDLMEFETRLSKIMVPPQSRRNFSEIYNKLQLGELKVGSKLSIEDG